MKSNNILFCMLLAACMGSAGNMYAQKNLLGDKVLVDNIAVSRNGTDLVMNMDMDVSKLNIGSNRSIVFTPVIQSKDGANSKQFQSMMVDGRKQHVMYQRGNRKKSYPDAIEIRRFNNKTQKFHYISSVPYQSWMRGGDIRIAEDVCGCGNIMEQNQSKVSSFNEKTPQLNFACVKPLDEANKVREKVGRAYLDFPVDKTIIYPEYRRNPQELSKIIETINAVKNDEDVKICDINIHGYASPESPYAHNTMLAEGRANSLKRFVQKLYKFDDKLFSSVTSTPENWEGLREYVNNSDLKDKTSIIKLIDTKMDADKKETLIKTKYPDEYNRLLKDCYPGLRRSDYVVKYNVRNFNLEEARKVYKTDPDKLSVAEMYAVANSYGLNSAEAKEVIDKAAALHPEDATANLNAGIIALDSDELNTAESYLNKAGLSAEADNARGVLTAKQGKYTEAESYFKNAMDKGFKDAADNLKKIKDYKD